MRVAVLGTGLIGASIGIGLAEAGDEVVGWDPDPDALRVAEERGAVSAATSIEDAVAGADVVVLAGPPRAVLGHVAELASDALVVDVSSAKQAIVAASRLPRFVGSHPMAGREVTGPEAATGSLFRGAAWVVVTDGAAEDDIATVEALVRRLGARPVRMTAADHDTAVAVVSHLPQLLASTLMNEASDRTDALDLVAGSFRDLTRVAASDPALWVDVLDANRDSVLSVLDDFTDRLHRLASAIANRDTAAMAADLERAHVARRDLGLHLAAVRVALADQPGELAKVGHAFESSGADIRDLQLRHAPYGGGGVLTVSVRASDEASLRRALEAEGLLLAD